MDICGGKSLGWIIGKSRFRHIHLISVWGDHMRPLTLRRNGEIEDTDFTLLIESEWVVESQDGEFGRKK